MADTLPLDMARRVVSAGLGRMAAGLACVTPAIMFWHHATMLMRPGRMNPWRWSRVLAEYLIAIIAIYVQLNTDLMFTEGVGDPLYLNTLQQGRMYPLFMGFLFLFTILSLINLIRSARIAPALMPRRQLNILVAATVTAGLSGPIAFLAFVFDITLPRVILSALLGLAVLLMGYGVARYSALIDHRVMGRDFVYNGVAIFLVAALYLSVGWISVEAYGVPAAALAFIVILAIYTHLLVDIGRQILDFVFYRRETRELRTRLRSLVARVGETQVLEENISLILKSLCVSVRATYGLILVFESDTASQLTSYKWPREQVKLPASNLMFDDVIQAEPGDYASPLEESVLLIPLYIGMKQIGILILGQPENAVHYSRSDVDRLLELSDRISEGIHSLQREAEYLSRLTEFARIQQPPIDSTVDLIPVKEVEEALRNLHDFAFLGNRPLANLEQVKKRLPAGAVTHLDRGREVHHVLQEAMDKLRPSAESPREPIPREWFPYVILHDAYVKGVQNRDIMSKLYISEGMFNRIRRTTIRSFARALVEMERSA